MYRFPDDQTLEIELKLRWASQDRQPIASYNVVNMIAGGLLIEEGMELLDMMKITSPTIKITTYSTDGGYRYKSETSFETLQKIFNKSISYEEWISAANAGFR